MTATDEDIIRDLLHRYASDVRPPAWIATAVAARQRRRDRRRAGSRPRAWRSAPRLACSPSSLGTRPRRLAALAQPAGSG